MDEQVRRRQAIAEARSRLDRLAKLEPRQVDDQIFRRSQPLEMPEPEPEQPKLDTDLGTMIETRIASAIGAERGYLHALLVELVGEIRQEAAEALDALKEIGAAREAKLAGLVEQLHQLRIENARARADVAELRAALASGGGGRAIIEQPTGRESVN